ncbi:MAG: glycosyltransferase [Burkholderiales bacterium]|nr:MAG: glycosyltransferase [Burkholderiales bacterium]
MIAIVLPAHNEAAHLPRALEAIRTAAAHRALGGERVQTVVALDGCTDASESIARAAGVDVVHTPGGNVGIARAAGARHALACGARWLAFTDADSEVDADWLAAQLALRADVVCGTVQVDQWCEWGDRGDRVRARHDAAYFDGDGHRHVHGANLGVSAAAYLRAGGFGPHRSSEDVALVRALEASGAHVVWSARPRVTTSARRDARAPGGFGALLARLEAELHEPCASSPA